jgi:hypothetical protein
LLEARLDEHGELAIPVLRLPEQVEWRERLAEVRRLSMCQQRVLLLKAVGLSYAEIAAQQPLRPAHVVGDCVEEDGGRSERARNGGPAISFCSLLLPQARRISLDAQNYCRSPNSRVGEGRPTPGIAFMLARHAWTSRPASASERASVPSVLPHRGSRRVSTTHFNRSCAAAQSCRDAWGLAGLCFEATLRASRYLRLVG